MTEWIVRAVGLFYAVGGLFVLRALARGRILEATLAALTGDVGWRHPVRAMLLAGGGVLTAVSGIALAILDRAAVPLMLANTVMQAVWLVFAHFYFAPTDTEDVRDRQRTINALVVYLAATVLMVWLDRSGRVTWIASTSMEVALSLIAAMLTCWQIIAYRRGGVSPDRVASDPAEIEHEGDAPFSGEGVAPLAYDSGRLSPESVDDDIAFARPRQLRLAPELGVCPLWDADSGRNIDPKTLGLSPDLLARIAAFEAEVLDAVDNDPSGGSGITVRATYERLDAEASAICQELARVVDADVISWRVPEG